MNRIPYKDVALDTSSAEQFKKKVDSISEVELMDIGDAQVFKRNKKHHDGIKKVMIMSDPQKQMRQLNERNASIQNTILGMRKNKKKQGLAIGGAGNLKDVLMHHKKNKILNTFIKKLKRNCVFREPVNYQPFETTTGYNTDQIEGITFNKYIDYVVMVLNLLFVSIFCIIFSMMLVFTNLLHFESIDYLLIWGIVWQVIDIVLNFIRIIHVDGEKLRKIMDIGHQYKKNGLWIDLLCLAELFICLFIDHEIVLYFNLIFFLKLPQLHKKISTLEVRIFNTFYKEQYWGLLKLIFQNFLFAHFISLFLILMAEFNDLNNWLITKNLAEVEWYQQYAWAYYWAVNIMLTVGFGDFAAVNYQEAIFLIFIEMISCMTLAYNINCVGNLISELRKREIEKDNNLKVLRHISQKNNISNDLDYKLKTHIEESYDAQIKIDYIKENQLITGLPENLKEELLCASNYDIIKHLSWFRNLTIRTIQHLASKIETKIAHPGEILVENGPVPYCYILKQGSIGYFPNFRATQKGINKTVIDLIVVKQKSPSKLVSLEYLCKNLNRNYDIKSIGYSIICHINIEELREILKFKRVDYEYFFILRDKQRTNFDEFEVVPCQFCEQNTFHSKFRCPRLHFAPIEQTVIQKHLNNEKISKNSRCPYSRVKKLRIPMKQFKNYKKFDIMELTDKATTSFGFQHSFYQTEEQIPVFTPKKSNQKEFFAQSREFNKTKIIINAAEQMKMEVEKLFNHEEITNFWEVQSDLAYDYIYYFRDFNPNKISQRKRKSKKFKVKKMLTSLKGRSKKKF